MDDYKFRILNITIENFKNVIFGNIDLRTTSDNGSSILGLYGQNGSGKTAMIDAIDLLKCVLRGFSVPKEYCDSINVDSKYSKFKYFNIIFWKIKMIDYCLTFHIINSYSSQLYFELLNNMLILLNLKTLFLSY